MEYNISKIQLKNLCRFCRNIDRGILYFYFSSKKCSSKVYTSLEKVVDIVTLSTTKLVLQFLDFSVICYGFHKSQLKHTRGVRNLFARRTLERLNCSQLCPYLAHMPLEKTDQVIGSSGMGAAEEAEFLRGACQRGPRKESGLQGSRMTDL
jgi:hypothetical protein